MMVLQGVAKADPGIASAMNRLGGVYRGNAAQGLIARRKAQTFASRKRFDLARRAQMVAESRAARGIRKNDAWEVPADHFVPEVPRRRTNYSAGNTVGKRMTGAVTGVAAPKKIQPTRVAPRTASGLKTPKVDNGMPMVNGARLAPSDVGKRDRRYNPEHNRQRRLGVASGVTGVAGAALALRGARGVREATHLARRGIPFAPTAGRPAVILEEEGKAKRVIPVPERVRQRADDLHTRGITASRGDIAQLAGGGALLSTSAGLHRYGRSRSNREWR